MIVPVIMAGGSGSRLWPLSRSMYPKQFLNIVGEQTMIQDTVGRLSNIKTNSPMVICNNDHRFLVAEQLQQVGSQGSIILEPVGRNTAPAIALAALHSINQSVESDASVEDNSMARNDPLLLVLAADHVIQDVTAFEKAVATAQELALLDNLVTFGIVANSPETGYGYIKRGKSVSVETHQDTAFDAAFNTAFKVDRFVEKPDREKAEKYLDSGDYYWNSGMFLFKASRYLEELKKFFPEILSRCQESIGKAQIDLDFLRVDAKAFAKCPSESIDYAVMEKTNNAVVVPLDAGWSDIGSWSAILEVSKTDDKGNYVKADAILENANHCLVYGEERLISVLGLDDVIVVDTKDALLVANKNKVQEVKKIVDRLKTASREEWKIHREVYRPWGKYDSVDHGSRYQVKRITVNPGAKLSVQMHHHRAEHWIVVSGTARVTNGDRIFLVSENESTYIPIGQIHALENPGKVPLELIEVQTGSYLGEDDIVRLEDNYGRA